MIECTYPVMAVYHSDTEKVEAERSVLAWGDAGEPYVLGDKTLILASTAAGFQGLRMAGSKRKPDPRAEPPIIVDIPPRKRERTEGDPS